MSTNALVSGKGYQPSIGYWMAVCRYPGCHWTAPHKHPFVRSNDPGPFQGAQAEAREHERACSHWSWTHPEITYGDH